MCVCVAQSCTTLCNPIDCSPPGPSIHGILQARTLEWVAMSFSKRNYRKKESDVTQSCPTLCDPMDCSLPDSSIHGIFQTRVLEWGTIAFSKKNQHNHVNNQIIPRKAKICFQDAFRKASMFSIVILLTMHFINMTHKSIIIKLATLVIGSGNRSYGILKWWENNPEAINYLELHNFSQQTNVLQ